MFRKEYHGNPIVKIRHLNTLRTSALYTAPKFSTDFFTFGSFSTAYEIGNSIGSLWHFIFKNLLPQFFTRYLKKKNNCQDILTDIYDISQDTIENILHCIIQKVQNPLKIQRTERQITEYLKAIWKVYFYTCVCWPVCY